ncbi:MAG: serine hydrolase [Paracoccaceae bacterium]|jgi:CubicO group peptidase (beta-lactamase class C family)|nr:serine hydrolase [Paracoccaceae bacterium]
MMAALATLPLARQPGTVWRYSVATDVLAHVIQASTGKDLAMVLQTKIFNPLAMQNTVFHLAKKINHG